MTERGAPEAAGCLNLRSAYDAVVVGGGHNGLAASAYLARAGRSCLLLERRAALGGAAVSEEVFPGTGASLSRYSYLVSLLPARIVRELALPLRLARRRVASYTPDPRQEARAGLLLDASDRSATHASFEAITGSSDLRQNRCFLYHVIGGGTGDWLLPVGGMGAASTALAHAARAAGATLRTRAEVTALEPQADAVDVTFRDGAAERTSRARHVLMGAAPAELERLLGAAPAPRPEGSQLKVNMLLARLPRLRDGAVQPERAFAGTFHVNETSQQLQRAFEQAARDEVPDPAPCECYCHSLSDPSILGEGLRSKGAHTLTVFGLHMPARLFEADNDARRQEALEATLASLDSVLGEPLDACVLRTPDGRGGGVSCVPGRNAAMAVLADPRASG